MKTLLAALLVSFAGAAGAQVYNFFPPPGMLYTASPNLLGQSAGSPVKQRWLDSSASTNAKMWQRIVDGSGTGSTLHEASCIDTGATCTDWLTITRADTTHPDVVDSFTLATAEADISSTAKIIVNNAGGGLITLQTSDSNPSTTQILIGSGDEDFIVNANFDALYSVQNLSTGNQAVAHEQMIAGNGASEIDIDLVPSTATAFGPNSCQSAGVALPQQCYDATIGLAGGVAWANGPNVALLGAGGYSPRVQANTTSQTDGFFYMPKVAGVPTGVPAHLAAPFAAAPTEFDTTDNRLYVYSGGWKNVADNPSAPVLSGTSGSIGGGALVAGACASGTVTVTGASTSMVAAADPNTYPGDGNIWSAQVTGSNTVTVRVCAMIAQTPTASTYNVRVIP